MTVKLSITVLDGVVNKVTCSNPNINLEVEVIDQDYIDAFETVEKEMKV